MKKIPSPHPSRSGQVCVTRRLIGAQVYRLPDGLAPGVSVRTLSFSHGFWVVEEADRPDRRWVV